MGKVEKVIVLSVLFLIALILVVSVTVDDPLDKGKVVDAGGKAAPPPVAQAPAQPAAAAPLLNAQVAPAGDPAAASGVPAAAAIGTAPAPVVPAPEVAGAAPAASTAPALPPGALLKRLDGLEDSWFPELKLYTWQAGDSWRKLADDYYGNWERNDVLKRHNEGRMDVQPGEKVFIPVFANERAMLAAQAQPEGGAAATPAVNVGGAHTAAPVAASAKAAGPSGRKLHVVASGESLWKIAKAELGDGNRWKEIYELNRDVLDKPESIKKGMRLRLP